ncbi:MAG: hypothetical protein P8184_20695, partial [Calditrichia bacterium]
MKKLLLFVSLMLFSLLMFLSSSGYAASPEKAAVLNKQLAPQAAEYTYSLFNINNFSGWMGDDGMSGHNPVLNRGGVTYPRGTAAVIYQDGLVWGGYIHDGKEPSLRVGGQTYIIGTQPGRILSTGVAQYPADPRARIYRIRPDWQTVS